MILVSFAFFSLLNLESLDLFGLNIENHTVLASLWTKDPFINNFTKFNWSILYAIHDSLTLRDVRSVGNVQQTVRSVYFLIHFNLWKSHLPCDSFQNQIFDPFEPKNLKKKSLPIFSCVVFGNFKIFLLRIGTWLLKILLSDSQILLYWEIIMGCGSK